MIRHSISRLSTVAFLFPASALLNACAARSAESLIPSVTAQDSLASRVACDSIVSYAAQGGQRVYRESEVQAPAELIFEGRGPKYPDGWEPANAHSDHDTRQGATIRTVFIVDSTGHADTTTFRPTSSAPYQFLRSVKTYIATARYKPAQVAAGAAAQCVNQSFVFVPS